MNSYSHLSTKALQQACYELEVYVQDRSVGVLYEDNGYFRFQYAPKVAEDDFVSLLMPVRRQPYSGMGANELPPVFDMNLPEGSLRNELVKRYGKVVNGFNDLALLSLVGRTLMGRVTVGGTRVAATHTLDVAALMESHDADTLLSQLYRGDAILSGIAGAQPKVLANIDSKDLRKFSDTLAGNADTRRTIRSDDLIVKTSGVDTPWLAANEYHCLRAAALSGLVVPDIWLFREGQVLVVSRFDRDTNNQALGAEDFCALNGMIATHKYSSTYERAAKTIALFSSPEQGLMDQKTLFHSLTLSCVLRNGDAHLKNFTLLYDNMPPLNPWLAPVYDVCTTNVYLPGDRLALTLAGSKRYPTKRKLDVFGREHCRLRSEEIEQIYDQVETGVNQAAQEMLDYSQQYPNFSTTVGKKMLTCWTLGLEALERCLIV